jgi:hypothetical protein
MKPTKVKVPELEVKVPKVTVPKAIAPVTVKNELHSFVGVHWVASQRVRQAWRGRAGGVQEKEPSGHFKARSFFAFDQKLRV